MPKLTKAQAEVVLRLEEEHWLSGENPTVNPRDVFPNQDNRDIGSRRTFNNMVTAGYFTRSTRFYQTAPGDLYEVNVAALRSAYQDWWKSQGFKDLCEIFPNGY